MPCVPRRPCRATAAEQHTRFPSTVFASSWKAGGARHETRCRPTEGLAIGPDPTGNLLEVIWLELAEVELVIHAMPLRHVFYDLLPTGEDPTT